MTTWISNYLRTSEGYLTPAPNDDWQRLVSEGVSLIEQETAAFWAKGDLCLRVDRTYGEGSIKRFASDTGLGAEKTLYEMAQLSEFFPKDVREQVPTLKKEHFRQAFRAIKKAQKPVDNPLPIALAHLSQAEDEGWSAAKMAREMKLFLGEQAKETWRFEPTAIQLAEKSAALVLSEEDIDRLAKALAFQGKEGFEISLNISYVHPAKEN